MYITLQIQLYALIDRRWPTHEMRLIVMLHVLQIEDERKKKRKPAKLKWRYAVKSLCTIMYLLYKLSCLCLNVLA